MKKITTIATALFAVSILASAALAASPIVYEDDESAISQIREQGIEAFLPDVTAASGQGYRDLQNTVDTDNARFQWDTQISGTACLSSDPSYHSLQAEVDRDLSRLSAE